MESTEESLRIALQQQNLPIRFSDLSRTLEADGLQADKLIGKGTYSVVVRAKDTKRNKYVAVKIVSKRFADENYITRYVPRELDILKELRHPHIIQFYIHIETSFCFYTVMQYGEGGSLLQMVRNRGRLSESTALRYFRQLADALEYIHKRGIAHRDVKCENIVLDAKDTLKLIDFGFARRVSDTEHNSGGKSPSPCLSKTFCGSLLYASPELLELKLYKPIPCDVWAAGVVLYVILFGRAPFTNNKDSKVVLEHIRQGMKIPEDIQVSQKAEQMLKKIFVPADKRPTATQLRQSPWLQQTPEDSVSKLRKRLQKSETRSAENVESIAARNGISDRKRLKSDQAKKA